MALAMRAAFWRFGQWQISYDLGRAALRLLFGNHQPYYQAIQNILLGNGFVMVQQSVYQHPGCPFGYALGTVMQIVGACPWMQQATPAGDLTLHSLIISVATPPLDFTAYAQTGNVALVPPFPLI